MMNRIHQRRAVRKRDRRRFVPSRFNALVCVAVIASSLGARTDEAQKLHAWDLIRVTVTGLFGPGDTELLRRVNEKGKITLPHASGEIDAADTTTDEIAKAIDEHYREQDVVQKAQCRVEVVETADKPSVPPGPAFRGNVLEVRIWDLTSPNADSLIKASVDNDGKIVLPLIGKIKVVEMTDGQIEDAIVKAYSDAGLIQRAPVAVRRLSAK